MEPPCADGPADAHFEAVSGTDKRVRFVGLEAYEAAGGRVKRDLFSEGNEGVQLLDAALLLQLTTEKLEALAQSLRQEGWQWIEIQPDLNCQFLGRFRRLSGEPPPLTPKQAAKVAKLQTRIEALEAELSEEDEDANEELYERINDLSAQIDEIEAHRDLHFAPAVKAQTGAVVSLSEEGEPTYVFGLLSKEEERKLQHEAARQAEDGEAPEISSQEEPATDVKQYSAALVESLTMHKTAALAAELASNPAVALSSIAHALVLSQFGLDLGLYRGQSCLQLSTTRPRLTDATDSPAQLALEEQKQHWLSILPRDENSLWNWCLTQDQATLLKLISLCAAHSINAVQTKQDSEKHSRLVHANALGQALQIDMSKWFVPTAENFFAKISKAQIAECLQEAGKSGVDTAELKKDKLAKLAESELEETKWLPRPLRMVPDNLSER